MKQFTKLTFFIGFLLISCSVHAQLVLKGTVKDAKTGDTLPGVNVYFANTTIGASTNGEGVYQIKKIPSGVYILVFSFVGYKTRTFQISIKNASSSRTVSIALQPQTIELGEAKVVSSNKEWKENFARFRKAFIGQTAFAQHTKIKNPWVISFSTDKNGKLVATSGEPLIIINKALGYKLHVELVEFKWAKYRDIGIYRVYPRFEPLAPQNKIQERLWQENRIKAYLGSLDHFLKNLYKNDLEHENFSISPLYNIDSLSKPEVRYELLKHPGLYINEEDRIKGYRLSGPVQIGYKHTQIVHFNNRKSAVFIQKKGGIEPRTKNHIFLIDENGRLVDPISLITFKDWGRSRIANKLPDNYHINN